MFCNQDALPPPPLPRPSSPLQWLLLHIFRHFEDENMGGLLIDDPNIGRQYPVRLGTLNINGYNFDLNTPEKKKTWKAFLDQNPALIDGLGGDCGQGRAQKVLNVTGGTINLRINDLDGNPVDHLLQLELFREHLDEHDVDFCLNLAAYFSDTLVHPTLPTRKADRVYRGDTIAHIAARTRVPDESRFQLLRALFEARLVRLYAVNRFGNNVLHELATTKTMAHDVLMGLLRCAGHPSGKSLFYFSDPVSGYYTQQAAIAPLPGGEDQLSNHVVRGNTEGCHRESEYVKACLQKNNRGRVPWFQAWVSHRERRAARFLPELKKLNSRGNPTVAIARWKDISGKTASVFRDVVRPDSVKIKARAAACRSVLQPLTIISMILSALNYILGTVTEVFAQDDSSSVEGLNYSECVSVCYQQSVESVRSIFEGGDEWLTEDILTLVTLFLFIANLSVSTLEYLNAYFDWHKEARGYYEDNENCCLSQRTLFGPMMRVASLFSVSGLLGALVMEVIGLLVVRDPVLRVALVSGASLLLSNTVSQAKSSIDVRTEVAEGANNIIT